MCETIVDAYLATFCGEVPCQTCMIPSIYDSHTHTVDLTNDVEFILEPRHIEVGAPVRTRFIGRYMHKTPVWGEGNRKRAHRVNMCLDLSEPYCVKNGFQCDGGDAIDHALCQYKPLVSWNQTNV